MYERAARVTGYSEQSLKQFKLLAELIPQKFRRLNLSWAHHQEVASLKRIGEDGDGKLKVSDKPDMDKIQELLKVPELTQQEIAERNGYSNKSRISEVKSTLCSVFPDFGKKEQNGRK